MSENSNRWQRRIATIQKRLDRVALHDVCKINYTTGDFTDFVFGCRADPSEPRLEVLCHELGHVLEFGSRLVKRRTKYGCFRFITNGKYINGQYCFEPTTTQITERECRAAAYSIAIQKSLGVKKDLEHLFKYECNSYKYLPDACIVPGTNDTEKLSWCAEYTKRFYLERCVNIDVIKQLKHLLKKVYENES